MRLVDPRSTENYVLPNTEFLQAIKDIGASIAEEKPQYTKQLLTEALFAIGLIKSLKQAIETLMLINHCIQ